MRLNREHVEMAENGKPRNWTAKTPRAPRKTSTFGYASCPIRAKRRRMERQHHAYQFCSSWRSWRLGGSRSAFWFSLCSPCLRG